MEMRNVGQLLDLMDKIHIHHTHEFGTDPELEIFARETDSLVSIEGNIEEFNECMRLSRVMTGLFNGSGMNEFATSVQLRLGLRRSALRELSLADFIDAALRGDANESSPKKETNQNEAVDSPTYPSIDKLPPTHRMGGESEGAPLTTAFVEKEWGIGKSLLTQNLKNHRAKVTGTKGFYYEYAAVVDYNRTRKPRKRTSE